MLGPEFIPDQSANNSYLPLSPRVYSLVSVSPSHYIHSAGLFLAFSCRQELKNRVPQINCNHFCNVFNDVEVEHTFSQGPTKHRKRLTKHRKERQRTFNFIRLRKERQRTRNHNIQHNTERQRTLNYFTQL